MAGEIAVHNQNEESDLIKNINESKTNSEIRQETISLLNEAKDIMSKFNNNPEIKKEYDDIRNETIKALKSEMNITKEELGNIKNEFDELKYVDYDKLNLDSESYSYLKSIGSNAVERKNFNKIIFAETYLREKNKELEVLIKNKKQNDPSFDFSKIEFKENDAVDIESSFEVKLGKNGEIINKKIEDIDNKGEKINVEKFLINQGHSMNKLISQLRHINIKTDFDNKIKSDDFNKETKTEFENVKNDIFNEIFKKEKNPTQIGLELNIFAQNTYVLEKENGVKDEEIINSWKNFFNIELKQYLENNPDKISIFLKAWGNGENGKNNIKTGLARCEIDDLLPEMRKLEMKTKIIKICETAKTMYDEKGIKKLEKVIEKEVLGKRGSEACTVDMVEIFLEFDEQNKENRLDKNKKLEKDDILELIDGILNSKVDMLTYELLNILEKNGKDKNLIKKIYESKDENELLILLKKEGFDENQVKEIAEIYKDYRGINKAKSTNENFKKSTDKEFKEEVINGIKSGKSGYEITKNLSSRIDYRLENTQKQIAFKIREIAEEVGLFETTDPKKLVLDYKTRKEDFENDYREEFLDNGYSEKDFGEFMRLIKKLDKIIDDRRDIKKNLDEVEKYRSEYGINFDENKSDSNETNNTKYYNTENYSYKPENGTIKTNIEGVGEKQLKLSKKEQELVKSNPETLKNIVNFYEVLEKVGLSKLWNIKDQIFKSISNVLGVGFNIDGDYLNKNEVKIFLNSILKSVGEKTISKTLDLEDFISKIGEINGTQVGGSEKIVNCIGDTKIEKLFFDKYFPRGSNNCVGFKNAEFEKNIK